MIVVETKYCKGCDATLLVSEFHHSAYRRKCDGELGYRPMCKLCTNAQNREWGAENNGTEYQQRKAKNRALVRKYGITLEEYERRLEAQGGTCATCGRPPEDAYHPWGFCVDHDHACCSGDVTCGKCVRGIICSFCNRTLGLVRDDPDRLRRLAEYVEAWKPTYGFPSRRHLQPQG
jgi:hypothetical protein